MTKDSKKGASRRDFLKLASATAPAAAVALTGKEAEAENLEKAEKGLMQDTAHTRAYFDSARF
ncbi:MULTISPECIES: twin-arginine translocation signal domain-containing protein [Halocynthiibacter]|uniref:Twin-arginine translocation signal domain-containing protein n=1 Tax=Halocynthiibacter halioticoli TaxID=2986804 RepID=A0AAE3LTG3_9RHOB|nr:MULTISPECIES: twin-arginine translocation signal domain-containing protein [Halocynthiibacter]MCV6825086.1 twin-arginine translocation signal domain-containing protein [Halocynthiibacter halioticoli]MCW4058087.1 twin-arginine translocation signal domain-containing protein [Halocynthiibacter sp. SDUM655004]MDE0588880.1 twin-arginine translocation signal domain-containing protein [Halocynthiibacter sp. C4]